ncbi:MAG: iron-containing alcohol dehydrogenase, partial [Chloroflexi bacterium]|nr:iron-containing alcohol dehydrogenase [Chloroflexota bacterium]
ALDHAVERVYLPQHHPLIDAACLEAIKLLVGNLAASRATDDAGLVARGQCQVGAWYSVFGWPNVRVGLSHIIGHQLGGRFGVPHGYTSCITMPAVIRFAGRWAGDRFAAIARALELGGADTEAAEAVAGTIERLVAELRLPARLRDVGVPEDGLGGLVDAAAHELAATEHRGGHVAPGATRDDVDRLVHAIW